MKITKEYIESLNENGRKMLKPDWDLENPVKTDEALKKEFITVEEGFEGAEGIELDAGAIDAFDKKSFIECIKNRKSIRTYSNENLSKDELSYLLYSCNKIYEAKGARNYGVIPSAGARQCLNTYVFIDKVKDIESGLYRYLPISNKLVLVNDKDSLKEEISEAIFNQMFKSCVTFIWTAVPYRMEYRYGVLSHKMIAFEAGHACQNLYLASENIDCGCCAISAFVQESMDKALKVDGEEEFTLYVAVVGKKKNK